MKLRLLSSSYLAGDERIELPPKVLETPIIPFDQSPMFLFVSLTLRYYIHLYSFCQAFFS